MSTADWLKAQHTRYSQNTSEVGVTNTLVCAQCFTNKVFPP